MHQRKVSEPHRISSIQSNRLKFEEGKGDDIERLKAEGLPDQSKAASSKLNISNRSKIDFLVLIFLSQVLILNWVKIMTETAEPFVFISYHIPATSMQIYSAISQLAWTLKPLIGLLSDTCPIWGYRKSPYAIVTSILGIAACLTVGVSPSAPSAEGIDTFMALPSAPPRVTTFLLVTCFFFVNMQIVTVEVLTQGQVAAKMNELADGWLAPKSGSNPKVSAATLMGTFVTLTSLGGIAASFMTGMIISNVSAVRVFLVAACVSAPIPIYTMFRGFGEGKLPKETIAQIRTFFARQKEPIGLTFLMFSGTAIVFFTPFVCGNASGINAAVTIVVSAVVILFFTVLLNPMIARVNFVFFISNALHFNLQGAMMYFVTDNKYQFPHGPNLSKFFATFVLPCSSIAASLLGVAAFQLFSKGWGLRRWQTLIAVIWAPTLIIDIAFTKRWNIDCGIPDEAMAIIMSFFNAFMASMRLMPFAFTIPRLCPTGMESTFVSLLFGCAQLGHTVSEDVGAMILDKWNVQPSGGFFEQDSFDNLWKICLLQALASLATTFVAIPLLPNCGMFERLLRDDAEAGTHNSLWKQWRSRRVTNFVDPNNQRVQTRTR
mmetsp:Transcript_52068/g.111451  ORF Transcript_52068/g.111451 Transcript_52068/m.111451 type:complete len:604 (-) Transcript_52068:95-1906(-)